MKWFDKISVSMMVSALFVLPQVAVADNESTNSNCANSQKVDDLTAGRESSRVVEAEDVKDGASEAGAECQWENADIALGESANEADRLFYLALAYQYGDHGMNQDYAKAMRLYREAAEAGSIAAMANIGCMYRYGEGVVSNSARAVFWFKKAADAGDSLGIHHLALSEAFGFGIERDLIVAKFLLLSNANYAPSAEMLRAIVKNQDITCGLALAVEERDDRIAALECAERYGDECSAEFDQCDAARYYGSYFYGKDIIASSRQLLRMREEVWSNMQLRELVEASQSTNVQDVVKLARAYANPGHRIQDLAFSETVYFHLLNELNILDEVLRKEVEKEYVALKSEMIAAAYIRNKAMNGDINSMVDLGRRYLEGKGVSYNYSESVAWFKAAIVAQRQVTHIAKQVGLVKQEGFLGKMLVFVKKNRGIVIGSAVGGMLGLLLFLIAGLFKRKSNDWRLGRRIEINDGFDEIPGEESEIDEGRHDDDLGEYDDSIQSSAVETSENERKTRK